MCTQSKHPYTLKIKLLHISGIGGSHHQDDHKNVKKESWIGG
jgi:hypothetical protein